MLREDTSGFWNLRKQRSPRTHEYPFSLTNANVSQRRKSTPLSQRIWTRTYAKTFVHWFRREKLWGIAGMYKLYSFNLFGMGC